MQKNYLCCLWCYKRKNQSGRVVWHQKYYLCGGQHKRVSRRHLPSPVLHPHMVPLKPSALPREFPRRSITPICSPCSTFLAGEGRGGSRKRAGGTGMLLSLPDDKVDCNKSMNLEHRKEKLENTSGLVCVKLGTTLYILCKYIKLKFPLNSSTQSLNTVPLENAVSLSAFLLPCVWSF